LRPLGSFVRDIHQLACARPSYCCAIFQTEIETNIDLGKAVFAMLKRKAERQLEIIARRTANKWSSFGVPLSICRPFRPSPVGSDTGRRFRDGAGTRRSGGR
jgi:hypothetical protein